MLCCLPLRMRMRRGARVGAALALPHQNASRQAAACAAHRPRPTARGSPSSPAGARLPGAIELPGFHFSIFNLDDRDGNNLKSEAISVETPSIHAYSLTDDTELRVECNNGTWGRGVQPPPCASHEHTVFKSSAYGEPTDNPSDPAAMTPLQLRKSMQLTFTAR